MRNVENSGVFENYCLLVGEGRDLDNKKKDKKANRIFNKKIKTKTNKTGDYHEQKVTYTGNFWRSFDYFNEAIDKTKEISNKLENYRIEKEKEGIRFYVFLSNPYRNSILKDYFHFDDEKIDDKTKDFINY